MVEGYSFVYTLSHNGIIFYVGKSKNVYVRYERHLSNKKDCELVRYIQSIVASGQLPVLNIITYVPDLQAMDVEHTVICCIKKGGQKLYNYTWKSERVTAPPITIKKEAYISIKKQQEEFFQKASKYGCYYQPSIRRV